MSMDVVERPDWFNEESYKRLKNQFFIAVWYSLTQSSFLPLPLSKAELKTVKDNVAMHFYISGSSFIRKPTELWVFNSLNPKPISTRAKKWKINIHCNKKKGKMYDS
jgi:hypothetical protein